MSNNSISIWQSPLWLESPTSLIPQITQLYIFSYRVNSTLHDEEVDICLIVEFPSNIYSNITEAANSNRLSLRLYGALACITTEGPPRKNEAIAFSKEP